MADKTVSTKITVERLETGYTVELETETTDDGIIVGTRVNRTKHACSTFLEAAAHLTGWLSEDDDSKAMFQDILERTKTRDC